MKRERNVEMSHQIYAHGFFALDYVLLASFLYFYVFVIIIPLIFEELANARRK